MGKEEIKRKEKDRIGPRDWKLRDKRREKDRIRQRDWKRRD
jgi:hypothetical protein